MTSSQRTKEDRWDIENAIESILKDEVPKEKINDLIRKITEVYEHENAKLILSQKEEEPVEEWVTTPGVSMKSSRDDEEWGGFEHLTEALAGNNSRPDPNESWTVHEIPERLISTQVWVGWAYNEDDKEHYQVAIWPGAVFRIQDESSWNDWDEKSMILESWSKDVWGDEVSLEWCPHYGD